MRLEALFLHSNGLHDVDDSVLQLPRLQLLSLHDNPIYDRVSQPGLPVSNCAQAIKQALARDIHRPAIIPSSAPAPDLKFESKPCK